MGAPLGLAMAAAIFLVMAIWLALLLVYARALIARWREPVFRFPVLVLESDDWGAGPLLQVDALDGILRVLQRFKDAAGRHPVMTLGMILEAPDTDRMATEELQTYRARTLNDECYRELRGVIRLGMEAGTFVPQLHGQCHYWPAALMRAARDDAWVRAWLTAPGIPATEGLPAPLQSRWIDGSRLPSVPLEEAQIAVAVAAEAESFRAHFGLAPCVAVATTFVWNELVEREWGKAGVDVVITPGRRATTRDSDGRLSGVNRSILTGDYSDARQVYLVRDVYFEPALGHAHERLVAGLTERTGQGRACLVEMHRFNFLERREQSTTELGKAIEASLARFPDLRFVAPAELTRSIRGEADGLCEKALGARFRAWHARLTEIPRFFKLAKVTGLAIPLTLLGRLL